MTSTRERRRWLRRSATAVVVLGLVAAACGGGDDDNTSTEDSAAATTEAAATGDSAGVEAPPTTVADTVPPGDAGLTPVAGGNLVMAIEAETSSPWRPSEMVCAISCHTVARTVYDTLTTFGEDEQVHPYVASAVTPNDDYTVWKITARDGVKFHDGTPFDGAAIVDNLKRHQAALLTGTVLKSVTDISVDPADPMTAVVTVAKPWVTFPIILAGQIGYMASPTWLAASDADETLRSKPVGTGPFIYEDYKPNEYFKAKKNPDYWNKPYPYLDSIEYRPIADGLTRRDALKAGDVQLIHTTNYETIKEFRDNPDEFPMTEVTNKGETAYTLLHVTQDGSPLNDQRVRCGLANATDTKTLNDTINQGIPAIANGPFSPTQVGYLADTGFPTVQNMDKAKELIAAYKAENPGKITLALATTNDQTNLVIANFQKQWYEEAGIDEVTIDQIDQGQYIVTALLGNFQVFQWRNHGGLDLDQQYVWWHSSSSLDVGTLALNFGRIKDAQLDALLDENRGSTDPARKKEIAEEVNKLFATQCYDLFSWWTVWGLPHTPKVHGVDASAFTLPDGTKGVEGSGIAGTFFPQTLWVES